jgi:hypothetical protein
MRKLLQDSRLAPVHIRENFYESKPAGRKINMSDPLVTYLEDHKAGAGLAIGLLQAMRTRHDDESLSQFAASMLILVEEDETLRRLAKKIGTGSNILKEAAAWVGEKASRIKLGAGSSGDFGTFEALEFLSLGIQGKLSLWHALEVAAVSDDRLGELDFETLISRANAQYAKVEERRLTLAKTALSSIDIER